MATRSTRKHLTGPIEKSLGFCWPRGINRAHGRMEYPVMVRLVRALRLVVKRYACFMTPQEMEGDEEIKASADKIFEDHGHLLWPDLEQGRPAWLADAESDDLGGRYPRNLYYSNEEDRDVMRAAFHELVQRQCIHYYGNHRQGPSKRRPPPVAKELNDADVRRWGSSSSRSEDDEESKDDEDYADRPMRTRSAGRKKRVLAHDEVEPTRGAREVPHNFVDLTSSTGSSSPLSSLTEEADWGAWLRTPGTSVHGSTKRRCSPAGKQAAKRVRREPSCTPARTGVDGRKNTQLGSLAPGDPVGVKRSVRRSDGTPILIVTLKLTGRELLSIIGKPGSTTTSKTDPMEESKPGLASLDTPLPGLPLATATQADNMMAPDKDAQYRGVVKPTLADQLECPVAQQMAACLGLGDNQKLDKYPAARTDVEAFAAATEFEKTLDLGGISRMESASERLAYKPSVDVETAVNRAMVSEAATPCNTFGNTPAAAPHVVEASVEPATAQANVSSTAQSMEPAAGAAIDPREPIPGSTSSITPAAVQTTTTSDSTIPPDPVININRLTPRKSEDDAINDMLERTEVEIDWSCDDEFPAFIQLEACHAAEQFFAKVDEQVPVALQARSMKAARIEHVNAAGGARKVSCRIVRSGGAGTATFRSLVRRLGQMGADACPELRVTIEWD
ncbi:hypothetical protein LTR08_005479 [Meristemomyces frigidus]|nr:hypothetical protein LTR08_005479 [Meristemomyces frigidus]